MGYWFNSYSIATALSTESFGVEAFLISQCRRMIIFHLVVSSDYEPIRYKSAMIWLIDRPTSW
jgi:hypothetical protein